MADSDVEIRKKLALFLDNDEDLINMYLKRFGNKMVMKYIKSVREMAYKGQSIAKIKQSQGFSSASAAPAEEEENSDKESPIYFLKCKCPVCETEDIQSAQLRSKSLIEKFDAFMNPLYFGTTEFRQVNYTLYGVTVCPQCFFASPDRKDFCPHSSVTGFYEKSKLIRNVITDLDNRSEERAKLYIENGGSDALFAHPRSFEHGILGYKLAIKRVDSEIDFGMPFGDFKKAAYYSRISLMERMAGMDYIESLKFALESYKTAYSKSDFPNEDIEFKTCYIIATTYIFLKQMREAKQYIEALNKISATAESQAKLKSNRVGSSTNFAKKWSNLCQKMWEDREEEYIWDLPKP